MLPDPYCEGSRKPNELFPHVSDEYSHVARGLAHLISDGAVGCVNVKSDEVPMAATEESSFASMETDGTPESE